MNYCLLEPRALWALIIATGVPNLFLYLDLKFQFLLDANHLLRSAHLPDTFITCLHYLGKENEPQVWLQTVVSLLLQHPPPTDCWTKYNKLFYTSECHRVSTTVTRTREIPLGKLLARFTVNLWKLSCVKALLLAYVTEVQDLAPTEINGSLKEYKRQTKFHS